MRGLKGPCARLCKAEGFRFCVERLLLDARLYKYRTDLVSARSLEKVRRPVDQFPVKRMSLQGKDYGPFVQQLGAYTKYLWSGLLLRNLN